MKKSFSRLSAVLLVLALQFAVSSLASADSVSQEVPTYDTADGAKLRIHLPTGQWDGFGFMPVLVNVENKSDRAQTWRFDFRIGVSSRRTGGSTLSANASFDVAVPGHSARETVLWLPGAVREGIRSHGSFLRGVNVTVTGPGVHNGSWSTVLINGWKTNEDLAIAVSPMLETEYQRRMPESGSGRPVSSLSTVNPLQWPADWRVWSPFSVVAMSAGEFEQLDSARQAALRDWVSLGGRLYLKNKYESRDTRRRAPDAEKTHGLGVIISGDVPQGMLSGDEHAGEPPLAEQVRNKRFASWQGVAHLLQSSDTEEWQLSRATGWLVLFLMVFGVLIGPVNLFLWAPAGKRHRLFFTVPVISLGASLMLICVIVFYDGFGGAGARRGLVVLMPGENKAVVMQQQLARTGMLLGKKFQIAEDTVFAKMDMSDLGGDSGIAGKNASRNGNVANGDWFTSRSLQAHVLMRVTPTRARVELVPGSSTPTVQSTMPGALRDFAYIDENGAIWHADEIAPGKRVTLARRNAGLPKPDICGEFIHIEDGRFYARADGSDLAPIATLSSIRWKKDMVLVTGRMERSNAQ